EVALADVDVPVGDGWSTVGTAGRDLGQYFPGLFVQGKQGAAERIEVDHAVGDGHTRLVGRGGVEIPVIGEGTHKRLAVARNGDLVARGRRGAGVGVVAEDSVGLGIDRGGGIQAAETRAGGDLQTLFATGWNVAVDERAGRRVEDPVEAALLAGADDF